MQLLSAEQGGQHGQDGQAQGLVHGNHAPLDGGEPGAAGGGQERSDRPAPVDDGMGGGRHQQDDQRLPPGLRALFFLVQGLLDRLVDLSTGLPIVLAFIGVKLVLHWGHTLSDAVPEIPTLTSLAVIVAILAVTTVASLARSRRDPAARAHAGSLRATRAGPTRSRSPTRPRGRDRPAALQGDIDRRCFAWGRATATGRRTGQEAVRCAVVAGRRVTGGHATPSGQAPGLPRRGGSVVAPGHRPLSSMAPAARMGSRRW
jgi:hypothetical protein